MRNEYDVLILKSDRVEISYTTSVETGCRPCLSTTFEINRSATNIFRSLDMLIPRISLLSDSIAI